MLVEPVAEALRLLVRAEEHALARDRHQLAARLEHVVGAHDVRRVAPVGERRVHDDGIVLLARLERVEVVRSDIVPLRLEHVAQRVGDFDRIDFAACLARSVREVPVPGRRLQHGHARLDTREFGHLRRQRLRRREEVDADFLADQRALGFLDRIGLLRAVAEHEVFGQREAQVVVVRDAEAREPRDLLDLLGVPPAERVADVLVAQVLLEVGDHRSVRAVRRAHAVDKRLRAALAIQQFEQTGLVRPGIAPLRTADARVADVVRLRRPALAALLLDVGQMPVGLVDGVAHEPVERFHRRARRHVLEVPRVAGLDRVGEVQHRAGDREPLAGVGLGARRHARAPRRVRQPVAAQISLGVGLELLPRRAQLRRLFLALVDGRRRLGPALLLARRVGRRGLRARLLRGRRGPEVLLADEPAAVLAEGVRVDRRRLMPVQVAPDDAAQHLALLRRVLDERVLGRFHALEFAALLLDLLAVVGLAGRFDRVHEFLVLGDRVLDRHDPLVAFGMRGIRRLGRRRLGGLGGRLQVFVVHAEDLHDLVRVEPVDMRHRVDELRALLGPHLHQRRAHARRAAVLGEELVELGGFLRGLGGRGGRGIVEQVALFVRTQRDLLDAHVRLDDGAVLADVPGHLYRHVEQRKLRLDEKDNHWNGRPCGIMPSIVASRWSHGASLKNSTIDLSIPGRSCVARTFSMNSSRGMATMLPKKRGSS